MADHIMKGWPDLEKSLLRVDSSPCAKACVLVSTGALNPVHRGHVMMLDQAKAHLKSKGWYVAAGFLSPSHDLYVGPKCRRLKTPFLPATARMELTQLSIAHNMEKQTDGKEGAGSNEDHWVFRASPWESSQKGRWPDFPDVTAALVEQVQLLRTVHGIQKKVLVFYVCGADHFNRFLSRGMHGVPGAGVVGLQRAGEPAGSSIEAKNVFFVSAQAESQSTISFSSTKIRNFLSALSPSAQASLPPQQTAAAVEAAAAMLGDAVLQRVMAKGYYGVGNLPVSTSKSTSSSSSQCIDLTEQPQCIDLTEQPQVIDLTEQQQQQQPKKRHIFISASALGRQWKKVPASVLQNALFFFGSKQSWLFPTTEAERREAAQQPGRYHKMDKEFLELVWRKLQRREVHFLKRADLQYLSYPGPDDPMAYSRASEWMTKLGYGPLQLEDSFWQDKAGGSNVVKNYKRGWHEYSEVKALLRASYPGVLTPVHNYL